VKENKITLNQNLILDIFLYVLYRVAPEGNMETMNTLIRVILSNGFPRLRTFIGVRIGTFTASNTWT
jgi:hypothetical protein